MKSITIMRHSYAESGYNKNDFDRTLSPKGYVRLDTQANLFRQENIGIDLCLTSSAIRAKQTSNFFSNKIDRKFHIIEIDWLYTDYTTQELIDYISTVGDDISYLLVVGHNPTLSHIATHLSITSIYELSPGAIVNMIFDVDKWSEIEARMAKEYLILP